MLSNQTRREVRGPFQVNFIIKKVEAAKVQFKESLAELEERYKEGCRRFGVALMRASEKRDSQEYFRVMERFGALRNINLEAYYKGHLARGYDETLNFLKTTSEYTDTLMLSQTEFLALDKDDTAMEQVRRNLHDVNVVLEKTKEYSG